MRIMAAVYSLARRVKMPSEMTVREFCTIDDARVVTSLASCDSSALCMAARAMSCAFNAGSATN